MNIKLHRGWVKSKDLSGLPRARVTVAPGAPEMGAPLVTAQIVAHDTYDLPETICSLRLSVYEARDLAARMSRTADEASGEADRKANLDPRAFLRFMNYLRESTNISAPERTVETAIGTFPEGIQDAEWIDLIEKFNRDQNL